MTAEKQHKHTKAWFHLPGLFEFHELYERFLALYVNHPEYFHDWCGIGSIYGAPAGCIWGGGRAGYGEDDPVEVKAMMDQYQIPVHLTFSNSLLSEEHLKDTEANHLCALFEKEGNGVIITSELLLEYIQEHYPLYSFISSTTKVLTDFRDFQKELQRKEFRYVCPDFRLNHDFEHLKTLSMEEKDKAEFLVNECCWYECPDRKGCYEAVSRLILGEEDDDHVCCSPYAKEGYTFSRARQNPGFISMEEIRDVYLPMGFSNFKIEGRSLGSALVLEFLLYYMVKPEYQINVRESIYLSNELDLF